MARIFITYENEGDREYEFHMGNTRFFLCNGQHNNKEEVSIVRAWQTGTPQGRWTDEYEVVDVELFRSRLEAFYGERISFDRDGRGLVHRVRGG